MSSTQTSSERATRTPSAAKVEMKLEVVVLPVSDVDQDPEGRSYRTYASFSDPDGNSWLLQEIKTRLPGRV